MHNNAAQRPDEPSLLSAAGAIGCSSRTSATTTILACLCLGLAGCGSDGETTDSIDDGNPSNPPTTPTNPVANGQFEFSASSLNVSESAGSVTFTIERTQGSEGAVSVQVSSRDGTASSADYTPLSTTVSFAAGEAAPKTVTLQITDDTQTEADETLYLALSAPTGGAGLGSAREVLVTILDDDTLPAAPRAALSAGNYQLHMEWSAVPGATSYRLLKASSETSAFTQVGEDLPATARSMDFDVAAAHLDDWLNVRYAIAACNAAGCTQSAAQSAAAYSAAVIDYLKASNTKAASRFGAAVALSADGNTLAVGAPFESSGATGIGGNQVADCDSAAPVNCVDSSGAVYIYTRTGATWSAATYLKPTGTSVVNDHAQFGSMLALSNDGNTLLVGAPGESSSNSGVNAARNSDCVTAGSTSPNCAPSSGAIFLYTRSGTAWSAPTFIKAPFNFQYTYFGSTLALSGDGATAMVGLANESSAASGVHTDVNDGSSTYSCIAPQVNCRANAGAVFVYSRDGTGWTHTVYVKAPAPVAYSYFGTSVALNDDGTVLAVGAESDTTVSGAGNLLSGAAYVYFSTSAGWTTDRLVAPVLSDYTYFGSSVSLSADGGTLAVGAMSEDSGASGVNGNQTDSCASGPTNCVQDSGAAYVFTLSAGVWSTPDYFKAVLPQLQGAFGESLALSKDGRTLVVTSRYENGSAAGILGWADPAVQNQGLLAAGAAYVFVRDAQGWSPRSYVKAANPQIEALFGSAPATNADGTQLVIGAPYESGAAAGLNGNQAKDCGAAAPTACEENSGAVYLY